MRKTVASPPDSQPTHPRLARLYHGTQHSNPTLDRDEPPVARLYLPSAVSPGSRVPSPSCARGRQHGAAAGSVLKAAVSPALAQAVCKVLALLHGPERARGRAWGCARGRSRWAYPGPHHSAWGWWHARVAHTRRACRGPAHGPLVTNRRRRHHCTSSGDGAAEGDSGGAGGGAGSGRGERRAATRSRGELCRNGQWRWRWWRRRRR